MSNNLPKGRGKIGSLHDNRPKNKDDVDFAKIVNSINMELWNMSLAGKPKTVDELKDRISAFFQVYQKYGINPTVERTCYCY